MKFLANLNRRTKLVTASIVFAVLALVGIAVSQTSFNEFTNILMRSTDPQLRIAAGTLRVLDRLGTSSGTVASSRLAIVTTGTTVTRTLAANECGAVVIDNGTSSTQTYTLPAIANAGCEFTFIAGDAGGEILINSAASATCVITSFAAVGVDADTGIITDTSCNTGLKNTAATNAVGDTLTLVSDGTRWLGVGITSGIWASQ